MRNIELFISYTSLSVGENIERELDLAFGLGLITKRVLPIGVVERSIFVLGLEDDLVLLSNFNSEGILSGGFAFVLQIYAQRNITPAPAAIIFSLEGVFATIAAWFLLNQILGINNLLGCFFILSGVLLSQLVPLIRKAS